MEIQTWSHIFLLGICDFMHGGSIVIKAGLAGSTGWTGNWSLGRSNFNNIPDVHLNRDELLEPDDFLKSQ